MPLAVCMRGPDRAPRCCDGAGAVSRFQMGVVIASGLSIGTLFTLFVVPSVYVLIARDHQRERAKRTEGAEPAGIMAVEPAGI